MSNGSASSLSVSSSAACELGEVSVRIQKSFHSDYPVGSGYGFRMRIDVQSVCGLADAYIFRYYQRPAEAVTGLIKSYTSGVCSWPDLEHLPIGEPVDNALPQAFRMNYTDMVFSSVHVADEAYAAIVEDIQGLVNAISAGAALTVDDPVEIAGE